MADWASLLNAPLPANEPTICECDGALVTSSDLRGQHKVQEILHNLPTIDLANISTDPKIGHKLQIANDNNTFLSAKSAFLPLAEKSKKASRTGSSILSSSNGFFDDFISKNEEAWWFRSLSSLINLPFLERCKLSPDDLIGLYSNTKDLKNAPVRSMAWHPHVAKVAVA